MSLVNKGVSQNPARNPELLPYRPEMDLLKTEAGFYSQFSEELNL